MKKTPFYLLVFLVLFSATGVASTWYVDPAASGSNNGTSWANAWTSFQSIAWGSMSPGDVVYLSGGSATQTYTTPLNINQSGSAGYPITIRIGQDSGHNGVAIFDGGGGTSPMINVGYNQWITVDGGYAGAQHFLLQNNNTGGSYPLISCGGGGPGQLLAGIIIKSVEIKHSGDGINCIWVGGSPTTAFVLSNSYIHDIQFDHAVAVNGSDLGGSYVPAYDSGAIIHDNVITVNNNGNDTGYGPDAIQGTNGITVYNNRILGVTGTVTGGQHQDGVQNGGSFYKVYNNFFSGLANSVSESDWSNPTCGYARFYNNVMQQSSTQPHSHGIEMDAHTGCSRVTDFWTWNNTFSDFTGFIAVRLIIDSTSITVDNSGIVNNIIYDGGGWLIGSGSYTCGSGFVIDHNNLVFGSQTSTTTSCNGSNYSGTNTITSAPVFVSYSQYNTSNNLHLQSSSAADIGTGVNLSNIFTFDKDYSSRPSSGVWDIGAYVASSSSTTPAPTPTPTPSSTVVTPTPTPVPSTVSSPTPTPTPVPTTSSSGTWTYCSSENGFCSFSGTQEVRYGANGSYYYNKFTGGVACNNSVFGDPAFGYVKSCSITTWTYCSSENQYCSFSGTHMVYFGIQGKKFVSKVVTGGIACTNSAFGTDPDYGYVKSCYIQ